MTTKVRFEFYNNVLEREETETLWAEVVDEEHGLYKLDNIPFFVTGFAADDVVKAEKVDDGFPKVVGLVEASGNSTIQIIFLKETKDENQHKILHKLTAFGAEYEGMEGVIAGYYSVNIPKDKDYGRILGYLNENKDNLDFREACMGWV